MTCSLASDCCKAEHDLMWKIWGLVGSNERGKAQREAFLKPEVRRSIVPLIRQARDKDVEAAGRIEKALLALGVPAKDIAPVQGAAAAPEAASGKTMLAGLKFPRWTITHLGCMSACLDYLGRSVPRAWLYGGTAHAFFINIHDDVDLESVTAWDQDWMLKLTPNLGFLVEGSHVAKPAVSEETWRIAQTEVWQFVRRCLLLNRPCYGWELKAPYGDYWLITGFDDTGYYYDGWETGGPTPWRKLGEQFIPVLDVHSVQLCEPASDEAVVRDALVAALAHARQGWDTGADKDAHFGPEAFDAWAKALESGAALRNHHAYNAQAWHECREMAVEFLNEAKRRLPGRADEPLDRAIASYTTVRDKLAALKTLTPIDNNLGWGTEPKLKSPEAAKLVREAGAAEREGLKALAQAAVAFGADPKAVAVPVAPQSAPAASASGGAPMPRIETRRLVLRPFTADDWRDFQELAVDWAAAPGPAFDKWRTSEAACRESVEYMSTRDRWFAMCLRDTGKVVGLLGINHITEDKQADVGHVILSKYQDNDLDKEALQAVIQYCFDSRGAQSIITNNAADHAAQLAPLKSLGFVNTNPKNPGELVINRAQWEQRRESSAMTEAVAAPTFEEVDLKLVVVQAVMRKDRDFMDEMKALNRKLAARVQGIGHKSEPGRVIGHWHWVDEVTSIYIMGVQVDSLEGFQWDYGYGLGSWAPGKTTFAKFREKNGQEGSVVRYAYGKLDGMGYGQDPRFMGEFEVWPLGSIGPDGWAPAGEYHEVWIPVVRKTAEKSA